MNDQLDLKKLYPMAKYAVIFLLISTVLSLIVGIFGYRNSIDTDSIIYTPNKFFCPLGEELGKPDVIEIECLNEFLHQEYSAGDIIVGFFISSKPILDLANEMYNISEDTNRKNDVKKIEQIEIPQEACYIGSVDMASTALDKSISSGLDFNLLHSDMRLYAWNKSYKFNSGKDGEEIHLIMILNENIVYGNIQQVGGTKMEMNILYGKRL